MKHHSKSEHVHKLMGKEHHNESSPADILMHGGRQHHAMGGATMPSLMDGSSPNFKPHYGTGGGSEFKKGGRTRHAKGGKVRHHHDDGGLTAPLNTMGNLIGSNPSTWTPTNLNGTTPLKRGGRAHHKGREHHFWGALAGAVLPSLIGPLVKNIFGGDKKAEGGEVNHKALKRAMGGAGKVRKGMIKDMKAEKDWN